MLIKIVMFIFICSFDFLKAKNLRNQHGDFLYSAIKRKSQFHLPAPDQKFIFNENQKIRERVNQHKPHTGSHITVLQELENEGCSPESTSEPNIHSTDQSLEAMYNMNNHENFDQILSNGSPPEKIQKRKFYNGLSESPKRSHDDFLSRDQVFVHRTGKIHKEELFLSNRPSDSHTEQSPSVETKVALQESSQIKIVENENSPDCSQCLGEHAETINSGLNEDSLAVNHAAADPFAFLKNRTQFSDGSELNHLSENKEIPLNADTIDFNARPRSFVFNPSARPEEKFQECTTPNNESGNCRYLQHCLIPSIISSLNQFMHYVCIIESQFIGVCCPKHPVSTLIIEDIKKPPKNTTRTKDPESNPQCGIATNTRIVGGSAADPKAWPWMVALLSKSKENFFCGGALINNQYVLTAAHCTFGVPNNEIIARLGEYDFKDNNHASHDDYSVAKIKRHGNYNRRTLRNDIALLKLEKPVVFSEFVTTICLPQADNSYFGKIATLAGWGNLEGGGSSSNVLQEATFEVVENKDCSIAHTVPIPSSLICTGVDTEDMGACNGDSGGPLMLLDDDDHWKAIGIVSWGRRGCNPKFPTVYTRVSHYVDWIKEHST